VDRAELELQLEVWKDLAINKQMLIGAAAEALGIKSDCSMDEIKLAFEEATNKALEANSLVEKAQKKAEQAISEMEIKVKKSDIAHSKAMEASDKSHEERLAAEHRVNAGREANSDALKKIKQEITEKDKALKHIKKLLNDSPENVVKKLKSLKKEKMDEGNLRKKAEDDARKQKKERQKAEKSFNDLEDALKNGQQLLDHLKTMTEFSQTQYDTLCELVDDKTKLDLLPVLDEKLIESFEALSKKDEKDESKKEDSKVSKNKKSKTKKRVKKK
jgi:hypothetical protein